MNSPPPPAVERRPGGSAVDIGEESTIEVIDRARLGDADAVHALIERAAPLVRRWARGRLPPHVRHDANTEDVVQDAVLQTLRRLKSVRLRTVGGLQAYLRTSVLNRIRDLIRGTRRRGVPVELSETITDDSPSPLELAIRREGFARFVEALQRLKPADRQVIIWRIELGYTAEEIARRMGKSRAAAGMTVSRAIARLAKELQVKAPEDS